VHKNKVSGQGSVPLSISLAHRIANKFVMTSDLCRDTTSVSLIRLYMRLPAIFSLDTYLGVSIDSPFHTYFPRGGQDV